MTQLYKTLMSAASDTLKELQPNTWDTLGLDVMKAYVLTWGLTEKMETESITIVDVWRDAILEEKLINGARYKAYVKAGGMYKPDVMAPEAEAVGTAQAPDFVMSGMVYGENISLETEAGTVRTTTERILSFTKFQQDVLRDTLTVYPSNLKKKHEANVINWVGRLVKHEKLEDDATLPKNMLADYILEYFEEAVSDPKRRERAIKHGRPIFYDGAYFFQIDAIMSWLKKRDQEYRWKKAEIKLYLKEIYGRRFNANEKLDRRWRCLSVRTTGGGTTQTQILDDSGSREDDSAHPGRDGSHEAGQAPAVLPNPLVLKSDGGGGQDTTTEDDADAV